MLKEIVRHRKFYFFFIIILLFLTGFFSWPLILNLKNSIYGYPGDSLGHIYYLWWWRRSVFDFVNLHFVPIQEAPFGSVVPREGGTIVFYWPSYLLAYFLDEVTTYNLLLLLTFPFSGIFAYLLFFEVTKNRLSSLVFSLVFAFSPYHFWKAYNHLDLAMIQYIPLFLWSLIRLEKQKNWKRAVVCGFSLAVLVLLNFYYGFFGMLTLGYFFVSGVILDTLKRRLALIERVKFYLLAGLTGFLIVTPFIFPVLKTLIFKASVSVGNEEAYSRPLDNLLLLSARPWSYFLPSIDNPFLGKLSVRAYDFIRRLSSDFKTATPFPHETTVFLGYFSLSFFFLTLILWRFRKIADGLLPAMILTIFLLFLTSMPPFIIVKGVTFYFPSFFFHQVLPMFRSYGRIGIFLLLVFSAVSSIGYSFVLNKMGRLMRLFIVFLSILIILSEFTNIPPFRVTDLSQTPKVYEWLGNQPDDPIVIEYPKNFNLSDGEFFQRRHLKKTANWRSSSPYFGLWNFIEDIYDKESFEILSGLGVRLVVFHKKLIFDKPNPVDDLWQRRAFTSSIIYAKLPKNIERVGDFDGAEAYLINGYVPAKVAVVTKTALGLRAEVVGGNSWEIESGGKLFILNLTQMAVKGELRDERGNREMKFNPGKSVIDLTSGRYDLKFQTGDVF